MVLTRLTTVFFFNLNASLTISINGMPGTSLSRVLIVSAIASSFIFEGLTSYDTKTNSN
jgi:hypothetical protein